VFRECRDAWAKGERPAGLRHRAVAVLERIISAARLWGAVLATPAGMPTLASRISQALRKVSIDDLTIGGFGRCCNSTMRHPIGSFEQQRNSLGARAQAYCAPSHTLPRRQIPIAECAAPSAHHHPRVRSLAAFERRPPCTRLRCSWPAADGCRFLAASPHSICTN
jgi:hypothetical protein